jgi:predicted rRNA methylase YqxC with S4 and FtsJ domains
MLKPQFEAGKTSLNKGVVKNDKLRRQILRNFEQWSKKMFVIRNKADSLISGARGNVERFYLLSKRLV